MKKKIAVLHAQVPFVRGGAEILVENLTKQLRLRGYDAELVSIPFKWYPGNALLDSHLMWRMVDLSESNGMKIDLVIALKSPTYLVKHPNKVVWLMHQHRVAYDLRNNIPAGGFNTIPDGKQLLEKVKRMDELALPEAKKIYSISKTVTNRLKHFNNINSTPLYHPPALEGQYYSDEYGNYILSVGRLDPNKRVGLLIQALQFCSSQISAVIAGKGNEIESLKKLAKELKVEDRVKFIGFVPDEELPKLYANALAVCFPPIDEDYGYITLEAFLSKRPIITCSDSGGVLEFAESGKSAFVCDCKSPEEMGAAMDQLFINKRLAADMGEYGYQTVKNISWDVVIDELTNTIR